MIRKKMQETRKKILFRIVSQHSLGWHFVAVVAVVAAAAVVVRICTAGGGVVVAGGGCYSCDDADDCVGDCCDDGNDLDFVAGFVVFALHQLISCLHR